MARTSDVGLSPSFWSAFPFCGMARGARRPEAPGGLCQGGFGQGPCAGGAGLLGGSSPGCSSGRANLRPRRGRPSPFRRGWRHGRFRPGDVRRASAPARCGAGVAKREQPVRGPQGHRTAVPVVDVPPGARRGRLGAGFGRAILRACTSLGVDRAFPRCGGQGQPGRLFSCSGWTLALPSAGRPRLRGLSSQS